MLNIIKQKIRNKIDEFTIRQLLSLWVSACVVVVFILAFTIYYSNKLITRDQELLFEYSIPMEILSSDISSSIAAILLRKSNLLFSESLAEFNYYKNRGSLDNKIEQQLSMAIELIKNNDDISKVFADLNIKYIEFQKHDDLMTNNKQKLLQLNQLLLEKEIKLETLFGITINILDEFNGRVFLDSSRNRKWLRDSLNAVNEADNDLIDQIKSSLFGAENRIQRALQQIERNTNEIIQQARDMTKVSNPDILLSIKNNQLIQSASSFKNSLEILKTEYVFDQSMFSYLNLLEDQQTLLMNILINEDQSLFNLISHNLVVNKELKSNVEMVQEDIQNMMFLLDSLSKVTTVNAESLSSSTRKNIYQTMLSVLIVSFLLVLLMLFGISVILFRINKPLENLRIAMQKLSGGILSTRLVKQDFAKDEFSYLVSDFNRFAKSNQELIEELSHARDDVREREQHTRAILENALVGIAHLRERRFVSVNKRFEEMFGYDRKDIERIQTDIIYPSEQVFIDVGNVAYPLLEKGNVYRGEWTLKRKDNSTFWCAISAKSIEHKDPKKGSIWLFEDITEQKQSEAELKLLANYDSLTGLPNRSLFMDRLLNGLERAKRYKESLAVLFIDLDRFKQVNDSLGHETGDKLLQQVANQLTSCVRNSDTVSRLGGDEFTIILTSINDIDASARIADKLIESLSSPFSIQAQEISITPSIGISIYPNDGQDVSTLIQNADAAMYHAKSLGRNNYQFYTKELNKEAYNRLTMENKLRHAIEKQEFRLYFQPYVDAKSREIVGYESLLRWQENELKLVSPADFIPVLEDTGMIIPVGDWICETACKKIKEINQYADNIPVSVNMSARQFQNEKLASKIMNILDKIGLEPKNLNLEITESIMLEGSEQNRKIMYELYDLGINISLDDFGTGYSSLAYLKRFPIDIIKIDKSFIRDIHTDPSDAAICEAIIDIAQRLHIRVIAEGVETEEQCKFLTDRGCQYLQGFLFGKPTPIELIEPESDKRINVPKTG